MTMSAPPTASSHRFRHRKIARGNSAAFCQIVGAGLRFVGIASPYAELAEASLQSQHLHLVSRLAAGTDHRDGGNFFARKMFRGDGARGSGAEVGDESVVEEECGRSSGVGVEHDDHAVVRRQSQL